jgi:hypothetical protein
VSELTYKEIRTSLAKEAFAKGFESELKRVATQEKKAFAPLLAAAIPVAKFLALNVALPLAIDWGVGKLFGGGGDSAAVQKGPEGVPQWRPPSIGRSPMGSPMAMGFRPQPVTGMSMGGARMPGAL